MKKSKVTAVQIPSNSALTEKQALASYIDAYQIDIDPKGRSALQLWLAHVADTPQWINLLMATRNNIVSLVGLKHLGALGDIDRDKSFDDYGVGDSVGIFTLSFISESEIVLTIIDKHLDVYISLYKNSFANHATSELTVSCVVKVHNLLGTSYLFLIKPLHRFIVPHRLARLF